LAEREIPGRAGSRGFAGAKRRDSGQNGKRGLPIFDLVAVRIRTGDIEDEKRTDARHV
jgi:hypothetical protein